MKILMIVKYPPIQGGVSVDSFWIANTLAEMGYETTVLSNCMEVEKEHRVSFGGSDIEFLMGYRKRGAIKFVSTSFDPKHYHIPQGNPIVSKMVSAGISIINENRPDFIFAYYFEPYGIVGYFLSIISGIPLVLRHAGSDLGRLIKTDQLQPLYCKMISHASVLLTRPSYHEVFIGYGADKNSFVDAVSPRIQSDIFFPESKKVCNDLILGVYGKTGKAKGTTEILSALPLLKEKGISACLVALWGECPRVETELISKLSESLEVRPYIPSWRMGDFIRSCDVLLFLENNFNISIHTPGIPHEVWSCGRLLVTTDEIAQKPNVVRYLNSFNSVIVNKPVTAKKVADAVEKARAIIGSEALVDSGFDSSVQHAVNRGALAGMMSEIIRRI